MVLLRPCPGSVNKDGEYKQLQDGRVREGVSALQRSQWLRQNYGKRTKNGEGQSLSRRF